MLAYAMDTWPASVSIDPDLNELANRLNLLNSFFKEGNLIGDTGVAHLVDAQAKLSDGGERDGSKIIVVTVDDHAILGGRIGLETTEFEEIAVDDGIVKEVVDGIVHMLVHIVVTPVPYISPGPRLCTGQQQLTIVCDIRERMDNQPWYGSSTGCKRPWRDCSLLGRWQ